MIRVLLLALLALLAQVGCAARPQDSSLTISGAVYDLNGGQSVESPFDDAFVAGEPAPEEARIRIWKSVTPQGEDPLSVGEIEEPYLRLEIELQAGSASIGRNDVPGGRFASVRAVICGGHLCVDEPSSDDLDFVDLAGAATTEEASLAIGDQETTTTQVAFFDLSNGEAALVVVVDEVIDYP